MKSSSITLFPIESYSITEIAEVLGVSRDRVANRVKLWKRQERISPLRRYGRTDVYSAYVLDLVRDDIRRVDAA